MVSIIYFLYPTTYSRATICGLYFFEYTSLRSLLIFQRSLQVILNPRSHICAPVIAQNTQSDFKVEILLECQTEPEEVKTFMAFKKVMKMITTEECEDTVESKLAEYEGRQCTVEYDTTGDGSQIEILKKIIIVE